MRSGHILAAKINIYIGACFVLAVGIFFLTIGFRVTGMENPIEDALAAQQAALTGSGL